ncbi:glycosyltransferase family 4 protein [Ideonella sp. YS5]|uniref:glycosyltransferase family 4 protein n=1 Tax=Ideonella sp. YS5 TaxID=3453714 RepID=UPI003EE9EDA7
MSIVKATPHPFTVESLAAPRRSLRIACVTETYPPEVNGVAGTLARMIQGLQQRNHEIQLIRPRQNAGQSAESTPGFHEVLMRGLPVPRYSSLRMGMPSKRSLVQLWATHRPDVVHIATEGPLGWSALNAALHLKLPVCSDFRTNFHAYSRHYGIGWLHRPIMAYLRKFHNRTLRTMVPTEALRRDLEQAGFRRLAVVRRGVDTSQFDPAHRSHELRRAWGCAPDDLVVGCVGRLAQEKNLGLLSAAFAAIRQVVPRARLVLVGEGPMRAELQSRWPDAHFAGQQTEAALSAHYASMDLFLFPSLTETFGNVTPEAMASGLPVVAFDYAAAAQIIFNGRSGALVPFGREPAFIEQAVGLARTREARQAMGAAAREAATQLGWDSVVARLEWILTEAISQPADLREPTLRAAPSSRI